MRKALTLAAAAGLAALGACNTSPREQAAADNFEDAADNAGTAAGEAALENAADAARATGANQAEDMRTNDADTNLSNGM